MPVKQLPGYVWDPRMQGGRYRIVTETGKVGRLISASEIATHLRDLHEHSASQFARLAEGVYSGQVTSAVFQGAMMSELKHLHLATAALGAGGWSKTDSRLFGRTGAQLKKEYAYLRNFIRDIDSGALTRAEASRRARLYADNAYGSFWREFDRVNKRGGMLEEILRPLDGACKTCQAAAAEGWVAIGKWVIPLHRVCRCSKEYR